MALLPDKTSIKTGIINLLTSVIPFSMLRAGLPDKFIFYGHVLGRKGHFVSGNYRYPTIEEFDVLVERFRSLGYSFVSLEEYMANDNRKKILLTFDDGFKVIYDEAHPYLQSKNIPYVIFVITNALNDPGYFISTVPASRADGDRKFLSPGEVLELKRAGVHVGFHTTDHTRIEDKHFDTETMNKLLIPGEHRSLFSEPLSFAYPYLAPPSFREFDRWMETTMGIKLFFDTKGFFANDGEHHFRVSIDGELSLTKTDWLNFVVKRQLLLYTLNKKKKL